MAIHFDYIKGLNGDVTKLSTDTTTSDSNDVYTYIKWSGRNTGANFSTDCAFLPNIIVSKSNALSSSDSDTQKTLGHIITSAATNQTFQQDIAIDKGKKLYINNTANQEGVRYYLHNYTFDSQSSLYVGPSYNDNNAGAVVFGTARVRFSKPSSGTVDIMTINKISGSSANYGVIINAPTVWGSTIKKDYVVTGNVGESGVTTCISNDGIIKTSKQVEALYFNATSDRRAKTHIQYWDTSALDIVTQLPIYEFHYKNNDTPSIGVIAQDAAEFDDCFTDFSLVDNANATGENGDYMTIKESKLVYILWKAVQEQQEQIEQLKAELNIIKESL